MIPRAIAGVKPWNGKKNPVTLVATVVIRSHFIHPSSLFPARWPALRAVRFYRAWCFPPFNEVKMSILQAGVIYFEL